MYVCVLYVEESLWVRRCSPEMCGCVSTQLFGMKAIVGLTYGIAIEFYFWCGGRNFHNSTQWMTSYSSVSCDNTFSAILHLIVIFQFYILFHAMVTFSKRVDSKQCTSHFDFWIHFHPSNMCGIRVFVATLLALHMVCTRNLITHSFIHFFVHFCIVLSIVFVSEEIFPSFVLSHFSSFKNQEKDKK